MKTVSQMTSLERMQHALKGLVVDRPPVALHNFLMTGVYAGFNDLSEWLQNGEMLAAAQLAVWKDFKHDALLVENGVTAMAQALGCEISYQKSIPPHVVRPILSDLKEIEKFSIPDPYKTHPLCEVIKAVKICRQKTGGEIYIMGRADQGPNSLAQALRGPEQWILDMMDPEQEEWVTRVLEFTTNCIIRYAEALIESGAHGSCIGGMGLSMLSPPLYKRIERPHQQRWCQAVQKAGGHAFVHSCGNESAILSAMVESGADCLELDPETSIEEVRSKVLSTKSVLGMLSPVIFELGSAQQVRDHIRNTLDAFAHCSRFIIGPGCALPIATKPENLAILMKEVTKKR